MITKQQYTEGTDRAAQIIINEVLEQISRNADRRAMSTTFDLSKISLDGSYSFVDRAVRDYAAKYQWSLLVSTGTRREGGNMRDMYNVNTVTFTLI